MSNQPTNIDVLVEENLGLVRFFAYKYNRPDLSFDDLYTEGLMGLFKAAKSWDPSKSKFSTYASKCIANELLMLFRKVDRHPYINSMDEVSTEARGVDKYNRDMYDFVPHHNRTDEDVILDDYMVAVSEYLSNLPYRERFCLMATYGINMDELDQRTLAEKFNISQSYVSRLVRKEVRSLRQFIATITCDKGVV